MSSRSNAIALIVIACIGVLTVIFADTQVTAGLDADRYALMESVVERGVTWTDNSSFQSIDRIKVGNHFYSGKPPLLSFAGAGVYWAAFHALGWTFHDHQAALVRLMIALFVALPLCATLFLFRKALLRGEQTERSAAIWTAALLACSLLLPFSRVFSNHIAAGALLFAAYYVATGTRAARVFIAALLAGLSAAVDPLPGSCFLLVYIAAIILRADTRQRALALLGAALPTLLHFVLNRIALGVWSPVYVGHDVYKYEGSIWNTPSSASEYRNFASYPQALLHFTFGERGMFVFMPLLLVGLVVLIVKLRKRSMPGPAAAGALGATFGTIFLVPQFSMGLAGGAYGPRHVIPLIPILYLAAAQLSRQLPVRKYALALAALWGLVLGAPGLIKAWAPLTMSVYAPLDNIAAFSAAHCESASELADWIIEHTAYSRAFGYYELGRAYELAGKTPEALSSYRRSLDYDSKRTQTLYNYGTLAGRSGFTQAALEAFHKITTLDQQNAGAWANYAVTLLATSKAREALEPLQRALKLNPNSWAALNGMMHWQLQFGSRQEAAKYAQQVRRLDPNTPLPPELSKTLETGNAAPPKPASQKAK